MRAATQRAGSPWRSPSKGLRSSTEVPSHQHLLLPKPVWDVPKRERNFFLLFRGSAHFSGVINRARCRLWLGCEWMGWEGLGRVREQGAGIVLEQSLLEQFPHPHTALHCSCFCTGRVFWDAGEGNQLQESNPCSLP